MFLEQKLEEINKRLAEIKSRMDEIELTPEPEIMDNQDVMQLLKISTRTLQNYRDLGVIPFYKVEGKIFYKRKEVITAIESYKNLR